MRTLSKFPPIFLNAVDLNDGRQKIFSQGGIVDLDSVGCRALWLGEGDRKFQNVTLAEAVAASSAIPLFFRPVTIRNEDMILNTDKQLGVFVDGGVADNLALNVVKAFAVHIHPDRGQLFQKDAGGFAPFREVTSMVLVVDGSMPLVKKNKTSWTRFFSVKRVSDAMMNQQVSDAEISTLAFKRNVGIPTWIVSFQFGMPHEVSDMLPPLQETLRRVRTHLDSFSLQECAVLSYCGYAMIETLLQTEV